MLINFEYCIYIHSSVRVVVPCFQSQNILDEHVRDDSLPIQVLASAAASVMPVLFVLHNSLQSVHCPRHLVAVSKMLHLVSSWGVRCWSAAEEGYVLVVDGIEVRPVQC
jgi:hypothetical protein